MFASDVRLDMVGPQGGFYHALTIRSPAARGRILSIEAPRMSAAYRLVTASDIPAAATLSSFPVPILAREKVGYYGEPCAILVGPDWEKVQEYAEATRVLVAEEEPLFYEYAARGGANLALLEGSFRNPAESEPEETDTRDGSRDGVESLDIFEYAPFETRMLHFTENAPPEAGDANSATPAEQSQNDEPTHIIEGIYATGIQDCWSRECGGAVAEWRAPSSDAKKADDDGVVLTLWTCSQWTGNVRSSVAEMLGLPLSAVSIHLTGGAPRFDGKIWYPSLVSCHAALASFLTQHSVRLILSRAEEYAFAPKRNALEAHIISLRDVLSHNNIVSHRDTIRETEVTIAVPLGNNGVFAAEFLDRACLPFRGLYNLGRLTLNAAALRTNTPPRGALCGFGLSQGFFALERHVSCLAEADDCDGVTWRKEHLAPTFPFLNAERAVKTVAKKTAKQERERDAAFSRAIAAVLDDAASQSSYKRKWAAYRALARRAAAGETIAPMRGIGVAAAFQGGGFLYPPAASTLSVTVTLAASSALSIYCPFDWEESTAKIWKKEAARILSLDEGDVTIHQGFPGQSDGLASGISAGPAVCLGAHIAGAGHLIAEACRAIAASRFRKSLPITVTKNYAPRRATNWEGKLWDAASFENPSLGAAVVEVEIDPVLIAPVVRHIWLSVSAGQIYSEVDARRSLNLSAVAALGWATVEKIGYSRGKISGDAAHYHLVKPSETPPIDIHFVNNDEKNDDEAAGAYGLKELPFSTIPAAYVSAVSLAVCRDFSSIPFENCALWSENDAKSVKTAAEHAAKTAEPPAKPERMDKNEGDAPHDD